MSAQTRLLSVVCCFSVWLAPCQLSAQDGDAEELSVKAAEQTMRDFARCVVSSKKREAKAVEFLKVPDGDPRQRDLGTKIAVSGCAPTGSKMQFQPDLFSRSVYTALYRKYYGKTPPETDKWTVATDYTSEYSVSTTPVRQQQLALRAFADCTASGDAPAAHRFAISEMRGSEEKAALPSVMVWLQKCLPEGTQLRFSRTVLKGLLAESLYKMRQRSLVTATSKGEAI
jgi:hypothetical protein